LLILPPRSGDMYATTVIFFINGEYKGHVWSAAGVLLPFGHHDTSSVESIPLFVFFKQTPVTTCSPSLLCGTGDCGPFGPALDVGRKATNVIRSVSPTPKFLGIRPVEFACTPNPRHMVVAFPLHLWPLQGRRGPFFL
jgi:hypothetical protein